MKLKLPLLTIAMYLWSASSFAQDTGMVRSLPLVVVKASTKKIPDKVWKGFSAWFPYAENPRLYQVNKNYLARFMIYNEENRALLTRRGRLIVHISYGYRESLPATLLKQVNDAYAGYKITRAIKVEEAGRCIWMVNIEDRDQFILLRLEADEMEEAERFIKSS